MLRNALANIITASVSVLDRGTSLFTLLQPQRSESALDALLASEQCSLEDVLLHDDLEDQAKAGNDDLMQFMAPFEVIRQLLSYVVFPAEPQRSVEERELLPEAAHIVLSSASLDIVSTVAWSDPLMELLLSFYRQDPPLDPTRSLYVKKILLHLFEAHADDVVSQFQKRGMIDQFVRHVSCTHVKELFLRCFQHRDLLRPGSFVAWLCESSFVAGLIELFCETDDPPALQHVCEILQDLFSCPLFATRSNQIVFSQESFDKFLGRLIELAPNRCLAPGLDVVLDVVVLFSADSLDVRNADDLPPLIQVIHTHMPNMCQLLQPDASLSLTTTNATLTPPLGMSRFRALMLFEALSRCNFLAIYQAYASSGILPAALELFFTYKWNNLLHAVVVNLIGNVLAAPCSDLETSLLTEADLIRRLLAAADMIEEDPSSIGYYGHMCQIIRMLSSQQLSLVDHSSLLEDARWSKLLAKVGHEDAETAAWKSSKNF